ncbi:hypothetical protein JMJ77_0002197, partial [Colletotrichum scovillei]
METLVSISSELGAGTTKQPSQIWTLTSIRVRWTGIMTGFERDVHVFAPNLGCWLARVS